MVNDENIYIIPNFDPNEIISYFNSKDVHISLEEIQKPTSKSVLRVFSTLVAFLGGLEEYWEDDGKYLFVVFKRTDELLRSLGITFFELKDLQFPSYNRNLNFLSTIYNFCIYKDSKEDVIKTIENENEEQKNALEELKGEIEMKKLKIRDLKTAEKKQNDEKVFLEKNIEDLEHEVKGIFKIQRDKVNQIEVLKKEKDAKKQELNDRKEAVLGLEKEIEDLKAQIVEDPNALTHLLKDMEQLVAQGRKELDNLNNKIQFKTEKKTECGAEIENLNNKISNAVIINEKMENIRQLKGFLKTLKEKNMKLNSDIIFEKKRASSLGKQISHIEMKIEAIKQKENENVTDLSAKLNNLRVQYDDVIKEKKIQTERLENNQRGIKNTEFESAQMQNKHQKQTHTLLCALSELKNQIKSKISTFQDFLDDNP